MPTRHRLVPPHLQPLADRAWAIIRAAEHASAALAPPSWAAFFPGSTPAESWLNDRPTHLPTPLAAGTREMTTHPTRERKWTADRHDEEEGLTADEALCWFGLQEDGDRLTVWVEENRFPSSICHGPGERPVAFPLSIVARMDAGLTPPRIAREMRRMADAIERSELIITDPNEPCFKNVPLEDAGVEARRLEAIFGPLEER